MSEAFEFTNIITQATTLVRTGPGILHAITLNTPVATGTITIYNGIAAATGTLIATVLTPTTTVPYTIIYDVAFSTGLTIVTGTATQNITVSFR